MLYHKRSRISIKTKNKQYQDLVDYRKFVVSEQLAIAHLSQYLWGSEFIISLYVYICIYVNLENLQ